MLPFSQRSPLFGLDPDSGIFVPLKADGDTQALRVLNLVWNPDTLAAEMMTQPVVNVDTLNANVDDLEALARDDYWQDTRIAYDAEKPVYVGRHRTHGASTAAASWKIWRLTWSGDDLVRKQGPLDGAWDDRASLSWGS